MISRLYLIGITGVDLQRHLTNFERDSLYKTYSFANQKFYVTDILMNVTLVNPP